jgi:hypothetical protein
MWQNLLHFIIFPLKGHIQLFLCLLVIFQGILMIVPHLHNDCQKQMLFLNSPIRQWRLSFVQCVQWQYLFVSATNCIIKKKLNIKKMLIGVIVRVPVRHNFWRPPRLNMWTTGSRLTLCTISKLCAACASNVVHVTVSVSLLSGEKA